MSEQNTQLAHRPESVKDYLALPAYKDRFSEVLGKRANQFMAAIVASSQLPGLKDAEPRSVIAAAMVAATLDLPVNPTLGQAHLVAYADSSGQKVAQFQIGYKGLIQLALRSGQYKRLNAGPVSGNVFKGYDLVGEPVLDWTGFDPVGEVTGYFCAFETLNGFIKVVYWSKQQAEAHAKRFSKAYAKGYSTPWKSDFDSMATKTVIKAALGKWGLLSVEMQKAVVHDQGAQSDVDADVKYVDAEVVGGTDEPTPVRPPPRPRAAKGANAIDATAIDLPKTVTAVAVEPAPAAPEPAKDSHPDLEAAKPAPITPAAPPAMSALADGEKLSCEATVVSSSAKHLKQKDATLPPVPVAFLIVKGGFNGEVRVKNGADDTLVLRPEFTAGKTLKLALEGKNGKAWASQATEVQEEF